MTVDPARCLSCGISQIEMYLEDEPEYGYRYSIEVMFRLNKLEVGEKFETILSNIDRLLNGNSQKEEILAQIEIFRYSYERFLHDYHNDMPQRMLGQLKKGKRLVDLCHEFPLKVSVLG